MSVSAPFKEAKNIPEKTGWKNKWPPEIIMALLKMYGFNVLFWNSNTSEIESSVKYIVYAQWVAESVLVRKKCSTHSEMHECNYFSCLKKNNATKKRMLRTVSRIKHRVPFKEKIETNASWVIAIFYELLLH